MGQVSSILPRWPGRLARSPYEAALLLCLTAFLGIFLGFPRLSADEPLEYQVKAAFLLNFTKFVEWPAAAFGSAQASMTICILGQNPFGTALNQIVNGELVNGRRVVVEQIKNAPVLQSCQVLFLEDPPEGKPIPGTGTGVLTVGEGENFLRSGGIIAFVIENHRVRFVINKAAAERAGLKLSSRLLNVAKSVEQ